jgi:hypothetical protein
MAGSSEYDNEPSVSIIRGEFLNELSNYLLKDSAA